MAIIKAAARMCLSFPSVYRRCYCIAFAQLNLSPSCSLALTVFCLASCVAATASKKPLYVSIVVKMNKISVLGVICKNASNHHLKCSYFLSLYRNFFTAHSLYQWGTRVLFVQKAMLLFAIILALEREYVFQAPFCIRSTPYANVQVCV